MPFPKNWENLPAETTPISAEALQDLETRSTNYVNAVNFSGVDPTGKVDSTAGLLTAIKTTYGAGRGLFVPGGKYKIGEGGTGLTLGSSLEPNEKASNIFEHLCIVCDPATVFEGNAALGTNAVVDLVPAVKVPSPIFFFSYLVFGTIVSKSGTGTCLKIGAIEGARVYVENTLEKGAKGLWLQAKEGTQFTANSYYNIGRITGCGIGIFLESPAEGPSIGVQGNFFQVDFIQNCSESITTDTATGQNSRWNRFNVNVIGQNAASWAINNHANYNRFEIGIITGSFEAHDVLCSGITYFRGYAEGEIKQEPGINIDVWNSRVQPNTPMEVSAILPQAWIGEPFLKGKVNTNLSAATAGGKEVKGKCETHATTSLSKIPPEVCAQLEIGMEVSGENIKAGTTIASITNLSEVKLSVAGEKAGTVEITFKPATGATWSYPLPEASASVGVEATFANHGRLRGAVRPLTGKSFKNGETLTTFESVPLQPQVTATWLVSIMRLELKAKAEMNSTAVLKKVSKAIQEKLAVGMLVIGTGIPVGTTIKELKGATEEIELSASATKTETRELTFAPATITNTRAYISTTGVITLPNYITLEPNEVLLLDGAYVVK